MSLAKPLSRHITKVPRSVQWLAAKAAPARPRVAVPALLLLIALVCAACSYLPNANGSLTTACSGTPTPSTNTTPGATATAGTPSASADAAPTSDATPATGTPVATQAAAGATSTATVAGAAPATPSAGSTPTAGAPCPLNHFIGAFSIDTANDASGAAQAGVQVAFIYGDTRSDASPLGAAYKQVGIKQVVGQPEMYLEEFECHRVLTLHLKSYPLSCPQDFPAMATESAVVSAIQQSVAGDADNPNVIGYWVLDDWPYTDTAQAAAMLPRITSIIHTYAPGKETICGFGASMAPTTTPWDDYNPVVFKSYTPQGCDLPAFYIYSAPVTNPNTPSSTFDWSMKRLLAHMLADLRARGWNPADGFVGIGQAWSDTLPGSPPSYEVEPTAADMAQQAAAFCQAGAVGAVFYAWNAGGIDLLHTPANDPQLLSGVQQGAHACQQIWSAGGP